MAKFVDFYSGREVQDIMDEFLERFPVMFEGFDVSKIGFVTTKNKSKKSGPALKVHRVSYPHSVWLSKTYIVESFEAQWQRLSVKNINLSVFRAMCSIPMGGFDEQSKMYGKVLKPDINMFLREYAAAGGVVNWEENPAAKDPMAQKEDEVLLYIPAGEAIPSEDGIEREAVPETALSDLSVGSN